MLVLERLPRPGEETSARNSGVIHSGIYYPPGSLKARLCVRGREMLYEFCEQHGVDHRRCGKLIVAHEDQVPALRTLAARAGQNGVTDLAWLTGQDVARLEPAVRCHAALHSPSTGILDVPGYVQAMLADMEAAGSQVAYRATVQSAICRSGEFLLRIHTEDGEFEMQCGQLVNSAGLGAVSLAERLGGRDPGQLPPARFAKGSYFSCRGPNPFRHLVYPMPNEAGLGVHATLDLGGRLRFGPDVQWVQAPEYDVDVLRAEGFYASIREYWPSLPEGALQPDYAGVRPKLVGPGEPAADFLIEGPASHGIPGLVNLLGIESPGLTSSLAIAEEVAALLGEDA